MWEINENVVHGACLMAIAARSEIAKLAGLKGREGDADGFAARQVAHILSLASGMKMFEDLNDECDSQEDFDASVLQGLVMTAMKIVELESDEEFKEALDGFMAVSPSKEGIMSELGVDDEEELVEKIEKEFIDGSELDDETVEFLSERTGMPVELIRRARFAAYDRGEKKAIKPGDLKSVMTGGKQKKGSEGGKVDFESLLKKADEARKNI